MSKERAIWSARSHGVDLLAIVHEINHEDEDRELVTDSTRSSKPKAPGMKPVVIYI